MNSSTNIRFTKIAFIVLVINNLLLSSIVLPNINALEQTSQTFPSSGTIIYQNPQESINILRYESKDTLGTQKNDALFVSSITDMYVAGIWQTNIANEMHSINPDSKVIVYRDFMNIKEGYSEWFSAVENNWILKDENGDYVYAVNNPINKIADRGNPDFAEYMANWVSDQMSVGFDGIFCDNAMQIYPNTAWTINTRPINPRTGQLYTDQEWLDDCRTFINHIKEQVPEAILIANGMPFTGRAFYQDKTEYSYFLSNSDMDGKFFEGTFNNFGTLYSESDWKQSVDMIIWLQDNYLSDPNKYIVLWSQSQMIPEDITPDQMSSFIFTSSLLGVSRKNQNYVALHGNMDSAFSQSLYEIDLGAPTEEYHIIGGTHIYERTYTNVRVLVNPTDSLQTLDLSGAYLDLNGDLITTITLQKYSGTILTPIS